MDIVRVGESSEMRTVFLWNLAHARVKTIIVNNKNKFWGCNYWTLFSKTLQLGWLFCEYPGLCLDTIHTNTFTIAPIYAPLIHIAFSKI